MQSFFFFFPSLECHQPSFMQVVLHLKVAKMAKKVIFLIYGAVLTPFLSLSSLPLDAKLLGAASGDAPVPLSAKVFPGCRTRSYSARLQLLSEQRQHVLVRANRCLLVAGR